MRLVRLFTPLLLAAALSAPVWAGSASAEDLPVDPDAGTSNVVEPPQQLLDQMHVDLGVDATEAKARLAIQDRAAKWAPTAAAAADFAAMWIDQSDRGRVKVAASGDGASVRASLPASLQNDVDVISAKHSAAEISATEDEFGAGYRALSRPEQAKVLTAFDSATQEFKVTLAAGAGPGAAADLAQRLRAHHPGMVTVVQGRANSANATCDPVTCGAPMRGGLQIRKPATGDQCSTGFTVMDSSGAQFVLTAGHCPAPFDNSTVIWQHLMTDTYWHTVGHMHSRSLYNDVDGASLTYDNLAGWNPDNAVWFGGYPGSTTVGPNDSLQVTSVTQNAGIMQGAYVCDSGYVVGTKCGTVAGGGRSGQGLTGLYEIVACTQKGMSGGPVFSWANGSASAYGLISQTVNNANPDTMCDGTTYFSPIASIQAALGLAVRSF